MLTYLKLVQLRLNPFSLEELNYIKTELENKLKIIKDQHKQYFYNNVFEELIAKSMHPSRITQFLEYDSEYDSN